MKTCTLNFRKFIFLLAALAVGCSAGFADTPTIAVAITNTPTYTPTIALTPLPFTGRIAFVQWDGNDKGIYIINADGSGLRNLTENLLDGKTPVWSPDGQYIAFTALTDGIEQIYAIRAESSDLKQLTFNKSPSYDPAWSPDGRYIAFSSIVSTSPTEGEKQIYIMKADGSDLKQLTFDKIRSYHPAWSSDGKYILFLSDRHDVLDAYGYPVQNAYVMKSDGSEQRPLTNGFVNSISWYPKENLVSVSVPESRYTLKTFIVNVNGVVQGHIPEFITAGIPSWSPSGEFVLFKHMRVLEPTPCSDIVIIRPDSLEFCFEIDKIHPPVQTGMPSWSPDGNYVIFSSNLDGDFDLYIVKSDGSELTQVTNLPGDEGGAIWWSRP